MPPRRESQVGSKAQVYHGTKQKTAGGLTKQDLVQNNKGRICSKKKQAQGIRAYDRNKDKMSAPYEKKG